MIIIQHYCAIIKEKKLKINNISIINLIMLLVGFEPTRAEAQQNLSLPP